MRNMSNDVFYVFLLLYNFVLQINHLIERKKNFILVFQVIISCKGKLIFFTSSRLTQKGQNRMKMIAMYF